MRERETFPPDVHPEIALLPWYVNGTLGTDDRRQVDRHLESCSSCRRELDELTHMRSALTAAYAAQPEPAPRLAQAVLARVAQESSVRRRASTETRSWLDRLDQWFRSLFAPQWVPTVAAIILIAQLGLLLWVTMPAQQEQVMTRSVNSSATKFNVVFQEQATEGHIRALLAAVHGRIVDGPDSQRMYIIEVTDGDPAVTTKTLEMLRVRTDIVQRAHAIKP